MGWSSVRFEFWDMLKWVMIDCGLEDIKRHKRESKGAAPEYKAFEE